MLVANSSTRLVSLSLLTFFLSLLLPFNLADFLPFFRPCWEGIDG